MVHINEIPERPTGRFSLRLPHYDYTKTGAYFVTVCAKERGQIFAQAPFQQMLQAQWQSLPEHFPSITLDEFVIMPDHIHCILWLNRSVKNPPTLGRVIGTFKSCTTVDWLNYHKNLGRICSRQLWQRGYYEHIIRNDKDLEEKTQYILDNPLKELERRAAEHPDSTR